MIRSETHNIISHKDKSVFWERHILDSLKIEKFLVGVKNLVDIGSGGGLPGIPLAIVNGEIDFFLVERREKKAKFLLFLKKQLNLTNVHIICKNFSEINSISAEVFVSRGVKLEDAILKHAKKLSNHGKYLYYKGEHFETLKYLYLKKYKIEENNGILIIYL